MSEKESRHIHFLELLKANLPKSGNKHKNSAKVDTFIFVWETLPKGLSLKIMWRVSVKKEGDERHENERNTREAKKRERSRTKKVKNMNKKWRNGNLWEL